MPNHTRTQADGTWVDGYTPPPSDWEDLERKTFHSWNGDRGGAYCPPLGSSPVPYTFNGSGLQVTGPTKLTYGGAIRAAASQMVIRNGAWPLLKVGHSGRTRSIVQCLDVIMPTKRYFWSRYHPYGGVGSIALSCRGTYDQVIERPEFYAPLRVVDGSTLTKVKITFRVASKRTKAPRAMPKFRVMRVPKDSVTNAPEPLKTTTDGLGFDFLPLVSSPDDWYLEGAVQSFTYVCDKNNVIDVENYSYLVHLVEELGALSVEDPFDGITLVERKPDVIGAYRTNDTLSGVVGGGDRVLVRDTDEILDTGTTETFSCRNGIWQANATWTRVADLDASDDFTPNWIVLVGAGGNFVDISTCWQCQYPTNMSKVNLATVTTSTDPTATKIRMVPAQPKGNIYHSLTPTFEVTDLRFQ